MSRTSFYSFPRVIALYSPVPGSGKTTVSNHLSCIYNYQVVPFAADLKDIVAVFLYKLGIEEPFAYIQEHKEINLKENVFGDKIDSEILCELGHINPRYLCQTIGTEWGRNLVHSDIWILLWKSKVKSLLLQNEIVCVDDCRFPNEFHAIKEMGGQVWKITRENHNVDSSITKHASEGSLDDFHFDAYIENNGTKLDLYKQVDLAIASSNLITL